MAREFDLLIKNGRVLDGTGSPFIKADIGVKNVKIAKIGKFNGNAIKTIDAKNQIVSPGFIDLHSHSDLTLLVDGEAQSKIRQGVTTEILGESGSVAPVLGPAAEGFDHGLHPMGIQRDWTTLGEYFARAKRQGISVNIASYVGTGQVRYCVIGNYNRPPTAGELDQMQKLVEQAMQDGAIGVSSGLVYPPNSYAKTDEIVELSKIAAKHGGIYATHIRSESDTSLAAIDEAIEIGEQGGLPVHIFHFKKYGQKHWGRMQEQLDRIQAARDRGVDITADQYPYIAAMTGLEMCIPPKFMEGTAKEFVARLKDPQVRMARRGRAILDATHNRQSTGAAAGAVRRSR